MLTDSSSVRADDSYIDFRYVCWHPSFVIQYTIYSKGKMIIQSSNSPLNNYSVWLNSMLKIN